MSDKPASPFSLGMESPCKNICVIDPDSGWCIGCGRTGDEIAGWIRFSNAERQTILARLDERLAGLTRGRSRKGGARAKRARSTNNTGS